jgi:hypothetical protein
MPKALPPHELPSAERCPDDPVGDGTHWFLEDHRCRYCGRLDPHVTDPTCPTCGGHGTVNCTTHVFKHNDACFACWNGEPCPECYRSDSQQNEDRQP